MINITITPAFLLSSWFILGLISTILMVRIDPNIKSDKMFVFFLPFMGFLTFFIFFMLTIHRYEWPKKLYRFYKRTIKWKMALFITFVFNLSLLTQSSINYINIIFANTAWVLLLLLLPFYRAENSRVFKNIFKKDDELLTTSEIINNQTSKYIKQNKIKIKKKISLKIFLNLLLQKIIK